MDFRKRIERTSYEKRVLYLALYSVFINGIMAAFKFLLAYMFRNDGGGFFLVSGLVNIFILSAKLVCFSGSKNPKQFKAYNFLVGAFVIAAGVLYTVYMARLLFFETMHIAFPMWLSLTWASIAFTELVLGVNGLFTVRGKGHMYRDIKLINLGVSLYAIVLTQIMVTSASVDTAYANLYDGVFGIVMGVMNIALGIFIWIAPRISLVDKTHNEYVLIKEMYPFEDPYINIVLAATPIYGKVTYIAINENNKISGDIVREYRHVTDLKWYLLIPIVIFYVILIIPYLLGAVVYYFYSAGSVTRLDKQMKKNGYQKVAN